MNNLSLKPIPAGDPRTARYLAGEAPDPELEASAPLLTSPSEEGEQESGALGTLADTAAGLVGGGVPQAINETLDFGGMIVNAVTGNGFRESTEEEKLFRLPEYEPTTQAGKAAKEIGAFAAGFFAGGKFLRAAKLLQGGSKMAAFGRGMAQGALSDFLTRDPHEERLSNILEEFPALANPVTEFLAAKEDDNAAVGRLKNALEGLALGVAFDGLLKGLSALKRLRKAGSPEEELRILKEMAEEAAPEETARVAAPSEAAAVAEAEGRLDVNIAAGMDESGINIDVHPQYREEPIPVRPTEEAAQAPAEAAARTMDEAAEAKPVREADELTGPRPEGLDDDAWDNYAQAMHDLVDIATSPEGAVNIGTNVTALRRAFENDAVGSKVLERISAVIRQETARAQGTRPQEWWKSNAEDLINTFGKENFANFVNGADHNPRLLEALGVYNHAAKMTQTYIVEDAVALTQKLTTGTATALDQLRFVKAGEKTLGLQKSIEDTATAAGRLLKSHHAELTLDDEIRKTLNHMLHQDLPKTEEEARALLEAMGYSEGSILADAMDVVETASRGPRRDKATILKALELVGKKNEAGWGRYALDALNEYRINALLSSPVTWMVNIAGPLMKSCVFTPVEQMIGGLVSRDMRQVRLARRTMSGMVHSVGDSIGAVSKMLKKGHRDSPILDVALSSKTEAHSATLTYDRLRAQILKDDPQGTLDPWQETMCRAFSWIGSVTRFPSRVMLGSDELLKQMNYRASLYAKFGEEAMDAGLKGEAATEFIKKRLAACFDEKGAALNADALELARRNTWTQELRRGSISRSIQDMTNNHPLAKFVLPFVRTPTNLVKDFIAHTPFAAPITQEWKAAMQAGGEWAAIAKGQIATGTLMWTGAITLAWNGSITGTAPQDKKMREALEATGWKPYSLKVGDHYYEYRRFDPLGMFLGLAADMAALARHHTDPQVVLNEEENGLFQSLGFGIFASLTNNLLNKTYLQGLSETLDVLNTPEMTARQYAGRTMATFLPFASGLRMVRAKTDDNMREMRNVMDYVLNTLPGYSASLPARVHYITGQPVTYSGRGDEKHDMVLDELARMAPDVIGAPTKMFRGVELSTAQLARYTELNGTVRIGGRTLHQALERLFKTNRYDLERKRLPDSFEGEKGPRALAIDEIIRRYRKEAGVRLLREDPELARAVNSHRVNQRRARNGTRNVETSQLLNLTNF